MSGTLPGARLPRAFFARDVLSVAPDLLGCLLTHDGVTVRITETEAYAGSRDPGSHAYRGLTPRTAPMFGPAGVTYVYFTYGMHWMLCLVTGVSGEAQAVLIRAGEVVAGGEIAGARRPGVPERDWCRGPARLAMTLGLDGRHTGRDFCRPLLAGGEGSDRAAPADANAARGVARGAHRDVAATSPPSRVDRAAGPPPQQGPPPIELRVTSGEPVPAAAIMTGPRVGVSGPGGDGAAYPWRFWIAGERTVSTYRPGVIRGRRRAAP